MVRHNKQHPTSGALHRFLSIQAALDKRIKKSTTNFPENVIFLIRHVSNKYIRNNSLSGNRFSKLTSDVPFNSKECVNDSRVQYVLPSLTSSPKSASTAMYNLPGMIKIQTKYYNCNNVVVHQIVKNKFA